MELLKPSEEERLYDPVRRGWVTSTPEEKIRQQWIHVLIEKGYPLALLAVEKEVRGLPHLLGKKVPKRRIDILAFAKGLLSTNSLSPLLLIECKAVDLTPRFARQVIGYNGVVNAPFIALANASHLLLGSHDPTLGIFTFKEGLLSYRELVDLFHNC